jgi:pilus assembly protein Flp/PilA
MAVSVPRADWLLKGSGTFSSQSPPNCPLTRPTAEKMKSEDSMKAMFKRLWSEEEGQDLIEYALLVALVALAATAGMNALATAINNEFIALGTSLTNTTS